MKFKSIFASILFIVIALLTASGIFVQTRTFAELVSKVISDVSKKKADTDIRIRKIGISFFPPGLELKQVNVSKVFSPEKKFYAEIGQIGVYLNIFEFEEKRISFGEIRLSDSYINVTQPESKEELKEIDREIINKIFDLNKNLPISLDTVLIENSKLVINNKSFEARRLKLFNHDDRFISRFHLSNIELPVEKYSIDEVWGELEIDRKNITIQRLKVQHDVQSILIQGKVENYFLIKNAFANFSGETTLHLKSLKSELGLSSKIKILSGIGRFRFNIDWRNQKIAGNVYSEIENLKSNLIFAEKINTDLKISDKEIELSNLNLVYKKQRIFLPKKAVVYNIQKNIVLPQSLSVGLENVSLKNILRFFGPGLKVLRGRLTGVVTTTYQPKNIQVSVHDNFSINNFGFIVGTKEKPYPIIEIKKATFKQTSILVDDKKTSINSSIKLPHSELNLAASIDEKKMLFSAPDSQVDLEDFGDIAGIGIKGKGKLSIRVFGPFDDIAINLAGKTNGFEVLGYKFGRADKDITIHLKDSNVVIEKVESDLGSTHLSGSGVVNYDNLDIALGINTDKTNYHDLSQILYPVFKNLTFFPDDTDFTAKVDAGIYGKTTLDQLIIKANVKFKDFTAYGETINSGIFNIGMRNQTFSLMNLDLDKDNGSVIGDFSIHLPSSKMKFKYNWDNLSASSFNHIKSLASNLDAKISGRVSGEGQGDNLKVNLNSKIFDTKAQDFNFDDSNIDIKVQANRLKGEIDLFGGLISSNLNLSLKNTASSEASLKFNIKNLRPLAIAFLGQHINNEDFSGKLILDIDTEFKNDLSLLDLSANLKDLMLKHEDFEVNYSSSIPQFVVENNQIKNWGLNIKQPGLYLTSKGSGTFGKSVSLTHEVHFNSKLLEILAEPILSADGFIRSILKIDGRGNKYYFALSSKAKDLSMTIEGMPFPINNLKYDIDLSEDRLEINELSTSLESGSIAFKGDVFFDDKEPDVNIKYILDKAEIPILGKSSINLSGEGILLGNNMPYSLSGDILINKAQILNELDEFGSKSNSNVQFRYLPKNQESPFSKILNLNLNVKAENPIRITNSLMDIALRGDLHLTGSPNRPKGDGRLFSPVNSSRIFFKNNEYLITNADLNFSPKKEISNPDFDVQASTTISSYKVYPKAYGDLSRFNFDLTSDPPLPRNSILSLIAFGYTDELQNSIKSTEQQNLTQVGVGSFVLDRFKISDILNKQFGLQIYLGTVFEQRDSLLEGRTQEGTGGGTASRTRSATKIELKKRLDEALSLSVSSTMGGSIGQRQNMTLNYSVNKKVQVEGIYELRTNDEGQEDIIDNSIGGDLKFRWTFK
ncbi:MAG: translocation/assembly module TamB domain-containing protein [Bacteriovoracaceae bacterium]